MDAVWVRPLKDGIKIRITEGFGILHILEKLVGANFGPVYVKDLCIVHAIPSYGSLNPVATTLCGEKIYGDVVLMHRDLYEVVLQEIYDGANRVNG